MTEISDNMRLLLADAVIRLVEESDNQNKEALLLEYKRQRAEIQARLDAAADTQEDAAQVKAGDAQVINLKPLSLTGKVL